MNAQQLAESSNKQTETHKREMRELEARHGRVLAERNSALRAHTTRIKEMQDEMERLKSSRGRKEPKKQELEEEEAEEAEVIFKQAQEREAIAQGEATVPGKSRRRRTPGEADSVDTVPPMPPHSCLG